MEKIGSGIITWCSTERRNDRYGAIVLDSCTYMNTVKQDIIIDENVVKDFIGKRVRLIARVTESRISDHLGDMAHKIKPTKPEDNEEIVIGIGEFFTQETMWSLYPSMGLKPDDNREMWWIDPHILYRLHDQSVELFIEVTKEPSPVFSIPNSFHEQGYIEDNTIQLKTKGNNARSVNIKPNMKSLGNGCFIMEMPKTGNVDIDVD